MCVGGYKCLWMNALYLKCCDLSKLNMTTIISSDQVLESGSAIFNHPRVAIHHLPWNKSLEIKSWYRKEWVILYIECTLSSYLFCSVNGVRLEKEICLFNIIYISVTYDTTIKINADENTKQIIRKISTNAK